VAHSGLRHDSFPYSYLYIYWGLIDILAILPPHLGLLSLSGLKAVRKFRILRFLRMLRVLKLIAVPTMLSGLVLFGMLMNVVGKAMMELLFGKGTEEKSSDQEKKESVRGNEIVIRIQSDDPEKLEKLAKELKTITGENSGRG